MPIDPITNLEEKKKIPKISNISNNKFEQLLYDEDNFLRIHKKRDPYLSNFNRNKLEGWESYKGVLNLEDLSAERQGNWELAGKTLGRFLGKIGTEVLKMPGYLGGAVGSPFMEGSFVKNVADNKWVNAAQYLDDSVKNLLYVHQSEAAKHGKFKDWILDGTFWATQGADGLGYIASFLTPGIVVKALGVAGKTSSLFAKGIALAGKRGLFNVDKLIESGVLAENIGEGFELATASGMQTMFEAASEAKEAMDSYRTKMKNSNLSKDEIEQNTQKIGSAVFDTNFGILLGPNLIMNSILLGRPLKGSKLTSWAKLSFDDAEKPIIKSLEKSLRNKTLKYGRQAIEGMLMEGLWEEGMQTTVSNYIQDHPNFKFKNILHDSPEIAKAYMEMLGTTEGQQSIFLGALFGSVMGTANAIMSDNKDEKTNKTYEEFINKHSGAFTEVIKRPFKYTKDGKIKRSGLTKQPIFDREKLITGILAYKQFFNQNEAFTEKDFETTVSKNTEELYKEYLSLAINQLAQPLANIQGGKEILKHQLEGNHELAKAVNEGIETENNASSKTFTEELIKRGNKIIDNTKAVQNSLIPLLNNIKTTEENNEFKNEFINAKSFLYTRNLDTIRDLKNQISILNETKNNLLGDSDLELDNNTPFDKKIQRYEEEIKTLHKELSDIFNLKKQQEYFDEVWKSKKEKLDKIEEEKKVVEKIVEKKEIDSKTKEKLNKVDKERNAENEEKTSKNVKDFNNKEQKKQGDEEKTSKNEEKITNDTDENIILGNENSISESNFLETPVDETLTDGIEENSNLEEDVNKDNLEASKEKYNQINHNTIKSETGWSEKEGEENKRNDDESIKFTLKELDENFIKWLENGESKIGEILHFEFGNWDISERTKEAFKAYDRLFNKHKIYEEYPERISDIETLKDKLPLFVVNKDGYKGIVGRTNHKALEYKKDNEANALKNRISLQEQIIELLLLGISIEDITTTVKFQKGGTLNLKINSKKNNSIYDLKEFEGNIDNVELLYANEYGELINSKQEGMGITLDKKNSGRLFTMITKNNGELFPLILNRRMLNENEANLIIDIIDGLLNKKFNLNTNISKINEDLKNKILKDFKIPLNLLSEDNTKIKTLLDFFINSSNKTSPNRFLYVEKENKLLIGASLEKDSKGKERMYITQNHWNNNNNDKIKLKQWLMLYKRHNIKTKPSKQYESNLTLSNKEYKKYLLDGDSKVLSTNVETKDEKGNQLPTFIGNSNIYFDKFVKVNGDNISQIRKKILSHTLKSEKKDVPLQHVETNIEKAKKRRSNTIAISTKKIKESNNPKKC